MLHVKNLIILLNKNQNKNITFKCGYLCIDRRNELCGRLFRKSCLVTDPLEVFLPRFGSLRSVSPQKCCFGQVRDLSFLIGVDCVVVGVSMITWLMNVCKAFTPYSHDQSLSKSK